MEQRRKLEHDLERYAALLRLVRDDRAIAALKELIRETLARLREFDQLEDLRRSLARLEELRREHEGDAQRDPDAARWQLIDALVLVPR